MPEDPILAAIAKLGDDLRSEIVKSRGETVALIDTLFLRRSRLAVSRWQSSGGFEGHDPEPVPVR